jgi:hypothetical protein
MPPDAFDTELAELFKRGLVFEDLQEEVAALFKKHGREVPPPITATITLTEIEDSFGGG